MKIKHKLKQFIPKYINNGIVLRIWSVLSFLKIPNKVIANHYEQNCKIWERDFGKKTDYIEEQEKLKQFCYGLGRKADYNACAIVAIYNALLSLQGIYFRTQNKVNFPQLISAFEKKGITVLGYGGTSPMAVLDFIKKQGYSSCFLSGKKMQTEQIKELQDQYAVYIYTAYNDVEDITKMMHTMCITKENGKFRMHNDFHGSLLYDSLQDAIQGYSNHKAGPISLLGIKA